MVYIKTKAVIPAQGVQKRVTTQEYLQGIGASHSKAPSEYTNRQNCRWTPIQWSGFFHQS